MKSLFAYYTKVINGTKQYQDILEIQYQFILLRFIFSKERLDSMVVVLWRVNVLYNTLISFLQDINVHPRDKVH